MKPGYKIIIAALLIYGGIKIKDEMDAAPYKESGTKFIELLKERKIFDIQNIIKGELRPLVSLEQISMAIEDHNLTALKSIEWIEWDREDNNYTLIGNLEISNKDAIPIKFSIYKQDENRTIVYDIRIGGKPVFEPDIPQEHTFLK